MTALPDDRVREIRETYGPPHSKSDTQRDVMDLLDDLLATRAELREAQELADLRLNELRRLGPELMRLQEGTSRWIGELTAERDAARKEQEQFRAMAQLLAHDIAFAHFGAPFFRSKDPKDDADKPICFNVQCSDTFAYACADGEAIAMEHAPEVLRLYQTGGWPAIAEWVQQKRGGPDKAAFIKPVQDSIASYKKQQQDLDAARKELAEALAEIAALRRHYGEEPFRDTTAGPLRRDGA